MTIPGFGAPPPGTRTFAPVEDTVVAYLLQAGMPSVSVEGPELVFPHVKVRRMPAGGDNGFKAHAVTQIDTFHTDRDLCDKFARRVQELIGNKWTGLSGATVQWIEPDGTPMTVYIADVRSDQHPGWMPWDDEEHIHRYVSVFTIDSDLDASPLL